MAAKLGAFLKYAWDTQPVITVSCGLALTGFILPFVSPYTKYTTLMNKAMPYTYPVPVRDDGNMPDIPAHPSDPQGNKLDWFKNFKND